MHECNLKSFSTTILSSCCTCTLLTRRLSTVNLSGHCLRSHLSRLSSTRAQSCIAPSLTLWPVYVLTCSSLRFLLSCRGLSSSARTVAKSQVNSRHRPSYQTKTKRRKFSSPSTRRKRRKCHKKRKRKRVTLKKRRSKM